MYLDDSNVGSFSESGDMCTLVMVLRMEGRRL